MNESSSPPVPPGEVVRLRVIAGVFGFFSLIGAFDYVMVVTRNPDYFEYLGYGERQIAYFANYPIPLAMLLTLSVWGTVLGSVLLLFRSRWAVYSLATALVSQTILDVITFAARDRWDVLGPRLGIQDGIVLLLTFGMCLYAVSLRRRRIIR